MDSPISGFLQCTDPLKDRQSSVYILMMYIPDDTRISVGSLGEIDLVAGTYAYTGSSKSGLHIRAFRHLGIPEKKRWHIDHITSIAVEKSVWKKAYSPKEECKTAEVLEEMYPGPGGFGSSDCKCRTHLFYLGPERRLLQQDVNVLEVHSVARRNPRC